MSRRLATLLLLLCGFVPSPTLHAADAAGPRSVLLIATEAMFDPRFQQSVVLVTRHGRNRSTVGVIVNRPFGQSLAPLFPGLDLADRHRLHYGGPVAPEQVVFLVRAEAAPAASLHLADRLYISSDEESLRQLLAAATPTDRLRVFRGFASWAPNQLEAEIDRGDWYLLPVDADALFKEPLDALWPKLWRLATQIMVRAPERPDAGVPASRVAMVAR